MAGVEAAGNADGEVSSASFSHPPCVVVDSRDGLSLFVADKYNHNIRKISGGSIRKEEIRTIHLLSLL